MLEAVLYKFFFFFFLDKLQKNLFKKKKKPTQVHWKCTMGGKIIKNPNYNGQLKQEGKNKNISVKLNSTLGELICFYFLE